MSSLMDICCQPLRRIRDHPGVIVICWQHRAVARLGAVGRPPGQEA